MRVLVACASRHGATGEIAGRIASNLERHHHDVDVVDVSDPAVVGDHVDHDAVVVGSAVYYGDWTDAGKRYLTTHRDELRDRPVWLFSSGPLGERTTGSGLDRPDELPRLVGALEHHIFPGRMQRKELSRLERLFASVVRAPEGDFRVWEEVDAWSEHVADVLEHRPHLLN